MERRFLFLLFLISFVLKESFSKCPYKTDVNVLIFGAGTAGVTAARVLYDHNLTSFKVLEAHDKIGGRIRNITFKGVQIEVGANWIHEAPANTESRSHNDNPIWRLARGDHLCSVDKLRGGFTESSIFMDFDNETQRYQAVNTSEIENDYIAKYKEALKTAGTNTVRQGLNMKDWYPDSPLKQLVEWSEFDFTYTATPNESVVSLTAENDNVTFGEKCFIVTDQRGFASVLRCMIANFSHHQDKVLTNANVTSIELYDECVCAEVMGQGRMCGDYGIVTFSIGVLQKWIKDNKFRVFSGIPVLATLMLLIQQSVGIIQFYNQLEHHSLGHLLLYS
uniref:Amine oxidase domain-containing protein n=1 Tax=Amphimedon queenslandica TaxID=400682 RepID=A0A1X7TBU9_AMPQE